MANTPKNDIPFDGPYVKKSSVTTDKSGAKHSGISRAKHLARMAADGKKYKSAKKMSEGYFKNQDIEDKEREENPGMRSPRTPASKKDLKGNQHQLDKNKNGKIDAHDFKLLRKEDVNQVDEDMKSAAAELSKYAKGHGGMDKADFQKAAKHMEAGDHKSLHKHISKLDTDPRDKILTTLHKHGNDIKRYGYTTEEVEQVDELNRLTLASYLAKASDARKHKDMATAKVDKRYSGVAKAAEKLDKMNNEEVEVGEGLQQTLRKYVPGYAKKQIDKKMDAEKFGKRDVDKDANYWRYKKVQDKLKKEEVEQVDELSKTILQKYTQKAKAVSKNAKAYGSYNADPDDSDLSDKNWKKHEKLEKGIKRAKEKMSNEEVAPVNELKRSTLASYIKKAVREVSAKSKIAADFENMAKRYKKKPNKDAATNLSQRYKDEKRRRIQGVEKASDRLAK